MQRLQLAIVSLFLLLLCASKTPAQSMTGSLAGTVTDSAGAAVPGAEVVVKDEASGATRKSVTNREGYFSFTTLPVGKYAVTVAAKGFSKFAATGVELNSSDSRSMNIELKVGSITETVVVEGSKMEVAPIDSGDKSALIDSKDLRQLSLVSRDAAEVVKLLPGSILSANNAQNRLAASGETVGMNVSGPLGNSNINGQSIDVTMDGGHAFDPGASGNSSPVTANQDMISEVKVLSSNFSAENAKGPVVVNAVSKAGGKEFHGDVRFTARNGSLNANDEFNKMNSIAKPNSSYYYPGFGVGGPLLIPGTGFNKSRQKVFFFDGFEYYKQQVDYGVERAFVATPAMLNGDFSGIGANASVPGYLGMTAVPTTPNWATGINNGPWLAYTTGVSSARLQTCTITEGVMTDGCIDPNAQALLKAFLPAPTTPNGVANAAGFNYVKDFMAPMNANQNLARVDVNFSDNTKLYASYNRERQTANWPLGLWGNQAADNAIPSPTPVIGGDVSDFVSATLMHVFSPSMTSETRFNFMRLSFPEKPQDPTKLLRADIPGFNLKGVFGPQGAPMVVTWGSGFPNLGPIGNAFHPDFVCYSYIPSIGQDITKVYRTHTFKAGMYYEKVYHTQDNWSQFMGAIGYSVWNPSPTGNLYADALMGIGQSYFEQAQPPNPVTVNDTILSFYAQDTWKATRRLTLYYGMRFEHYAKPYSPGLGLAVFDPRLYSDDPAQLDNNTGVVWHGMKSSVPLSGADSRALFFSPRFGLAYDIFGTGKTVIRGGWGKFRAYDSVQSNSYTAPAQTSIGSYGWSCNQNDPLCPSWGDIDAHATTPVFGGPLGPGLKSINVLNIGNDEQPLVTTYSLSIDQRLLGRLNAEISYVGNQTRHLQPQLNYNAIPIGTLLNANCPDITSTACQTANRPFHNYEDILSSMSRGTAQFDSLQATVHRNVGFVTLMLNYTYSKAIGNEVLSNTTSGYADYGAKEFYGVLSLNRAHALSAAYVFYLPSIHGGNAFTRGALNGWEISGITQVTSGANLTSVAGTGGWGWNFNLGLQDAGGVAQDNVHLLGTPNVQLQPVITCNPKKNLQPGYYLNPSCFAPPPGNGVNGSGRMPYLPGPMFWNSDLTAIKNFKITERQSLQFRIAAFDFLNHSLPSFVSQDNNLKLNFDSNGQAPADFGKATARYGHRIIQLGIKYSF